MELFGFSIQRSNAKDEPENLPSFAPEVKDDGAVVVAAGGSYGTYIDLDGTVRTEAELVTRYREMSMQPEVESAIDDIVNEAIVVDQNDYIVRMDLDNVDFIGDEVKSRIEAEFEEILELLNFNDDAYDIYKRWYVDGRLYYHAIIDPSRPEMGIKELRYIDPRKIRKIREVKPVKDANGVILKQTTQEYFLYNEKGWAAAQPNAVAAASDYTTQSGLKIAVDSVVHVTSGLMDPNNKMVLSYLHKAIKPLNCLRTLEDAVVIYRISRAPERRIFYVDVGNLPKTKAEQYLRDMMTKHKNRLVYDASTGEVRDDRKFMTMLEDYWLPRREGNRSTEIQTLPAGQNLGEMEDVNYFLKKLMKALGVPISRLDPESGMTLGRASEISRDEVKFGKFVARMRKRFTQLFIKSLGKNLVLKGVCTEDDWTNIARHIIFDFQEDNHFSEFKDLEIIANRIQQAHDIADLVGKYYSHEYVRRNILRQTDEEMARIDEQIELEKDIEQYKEDPPMMIDPETGQPMDPNQDPNGGDFGEDPFDPPGATPGMNGPVGRDTGAMGTRPDHDPPAPPDKVAKARRTGKGKQ